MKKEINKSSDNSSLSQIISNQKELQKKLQENQKYIQSKINDLVIPKNTHATNVYPASQNKISDDFEYLFKSLLLEERLKIANKTIKNLDLINKDENIIINDSEMINNNIIKLEGDNNINSSK
jgi:hypothetical protein